MNGCIGGLGTTPLRTGCKLVDLISPTAGDARMLIATFAWHELIE